MRRSKKMSPGVRAMLHALKGKARRRRRNPENPLVHTIEKIYKTAKAMEVAGIKDNSRAVVVLQDELESLIEKLPLSMQETASYILSDDVTDSGKSLRAAALTKLDKLVEGHRDIKSSRTIRDAKVSKARKAFDEREAYDVLRLTGSDATKLKTDISALAGSQYTTSKIPAGSSYADKGHILLSYPKEALHKALEVLDEEIDVPDFGYDKDARAMRSEYKKIKRRIKALLAGRLVNPDVSDDMREDNPRRRRRRRHFGWRKYGRRRFHRRRRNPLSSADLVMRMISGDMTASVLAGAALGGAAGYVIAGGVAMYVGDMASKMLGLAEQSTGARVARVATTLLLGGGLAAMASAFSPNTRGSMFAGVGARALRELVAESVPQATTTTSFIRNVVGLSGLRGFGGWDMSGYSYVNPVMNGYIYNAPAMNGYQYTAPAMNGLPSGGYQMRGLPSGGYQMRGLPSAGYGVNGLPNAGYQMRGLPNAGFVAR
jgi:hypothetical protein